MNTVNTRVLSLLWILLCLYATATYAKDNKYTPADSIRVMALLQNATDTLDIDPGKSMAISIKAIELSKESGFRYGLASAFQFCGGIYILYGKYDTAINLSNEAIKISKENDFPTTELNAFINLGIIFDYMEDYPRSIENFHIALNMCSSNTDSYTKMRLYSNFGHLNADMHDIENAKKYFILAMNTASANHWMGKLAKTYLYLSMTYQDQEKYTDEFPYLFRCIHICDSMHIKGNTLASAYGILSECYFRTGNNDSALYYAFIAIPLFKENGEEFNAANILHNVGNVYLTLNKLTEAEKYYKECRALAIKYSSKQMLAVCDNSLAELYSKEGDYKKAYFFRTSQMKNNDSLFNEEKIHALAALTTKFENKELENKNVLLRKDAELQQLRLHHKDILLYEGMAFMALLLASGLLLFRHNKLRTNQKLILLEQKQLLAQINPHFIFNCLNSVQQFIVQNDIENANKYLADFAMLMRQTLDNSKDLTIPLYRELEYLENYLSLESLRFEDVFSYKTTCAADVDTNTIEIPSMIIQPYVENAINHGLTNLEGKAGILNINFYKKDNNLFCEVDDNGIGMESAEKLKEQMFIKHVSMGMEMIRQRLELVSKLSNTDYKVSVINKKNSDGLSEGTTIVIKFPLKG